MKQKTNKSTKNRAKTSFWQQEVSFDLSKSPVLNFLKQDIDMDITHSPVVKFLNQDIDMNLSHSPVLKFLNKDITVDLTNNKIAKFLSQDIDMNLDHSPVLNFLNKKVVLDGFADVSASPVLNWFKPALTKSRKISVKPDEVVVKSLAKDIVISCFIVSLIINLFFFVSWVYYQESPAARQAIVQMIFG